jgi:hypothetical protein
MKGVKYIPELLSRGNPFSFLIAVISEIVLYIRVPVNDLDVDV